MYLFIYRRPSDDVGNVFHIAFESCERQNDSKLAEQGHIFYQDTEKQQ
jgi:hypothetical protein